MDGLIAGGVLCLDLAGTVGWAYGHLTDHKPSFGVFHLRKDGGEGARYASFENEMIATLNACEPSWLVLEAPLPPMAQTAAISAYQAYTLRGMAISEAWRASVPCSSIDAQAARLEVMGMARPPDVKKAVMAWCQKRGWLVQHHDAADACILWQWHKQRMRGATNGAAGAEARR